MATDARRLTPGQPQESRMTRTHRTHYPLVILAVLAGALALAAPANAANNTFSGAVNSSWNTAGNWSDGIPTSDDVV